MDFFPKVLQAIPGENFTVYAYMNDGTVRRPDIKPLIDRGGVFAPLRDIEVFRSRLTIMNDSVAWDISGRHDPADCVDIDPFVIFELPPVADPLDKGS